MSVLQDVFDVLIFIVLLTTLVWYVIFSRDYITNMDNWGFIDNDDKTARLVNTSDLNIYDMGRMSKPELILSAYVWDTKSLEVNTIVYSKANIETAATTRAVVFSPVYTIDVDSEYRADKLPKVKALAKILLSVPREEFTHMYVPDMPLYTPMMYTYSGSKGLGNFGTILKYSTGTAVDKSDSFSVSAKYGTKGDSKIGGYWQGQVMTTVDKHWEVIIE